jgi:hypothetical protein
MKACADVRGQLLDRETADRGVVGQQHASHPAGLILISKPPIAGSGTI